MAYNSPLNLPNDFILNIEEKKFFQKQSINNLDFLTTSYYFSLIDPNDPADPIRKQCLPSIKEKNISSAETQDPLEEKRYSPLPRLIHRYPNRVLIRLNGQCAMNCRFCYRREMLKQEQKMLSPRDFQAMIDYIKKHPEISEVLISGGDPLILATNKLEYYLKTLRKTFSHLIIRLCTRVPVVNPERINKELLMMLKNIPGLWIVTHFNHPREINPFSMDKIKQLREKGINLMNQSVLLKGVNDHEETLARLFIKLSYNGIKPYYLFQADLVKGTSHFRVDLKKGIKLYQKLTQKLSPFILPIYALDLPQGGGKIQLSKTSIMGIKENFYILKDKNNRIYHYPVN